MSLTTRLYQEVLILQRDCTRVLQFNKALKPGCFVFTTRLYQDFLVLQRGFTGVFWFYNAFFPDCFSSLRRTKTVSVCYAPRRVLDTPNPLWEWGELHYLEVASCTLPAPKSQTRNAKRENRWQRGTQRRLTSPLPVDLFIDLR